MTTTQRRFEIETEDIEYQRTDGTPLLATVYRPVGAGPFPTVLEVHGGGWRQGDRFNTKAIDEGVSRGGVVVMSIDFRAANVAPYPTSLEDINLAVRWLKAHAVEFRGRPEVGAMGSSSGGHQVLLTALRPRDPRYARLRLDENPALDASLSCVVGFWPVADPVAMHRNLLAKEPGQPTMCDNYFGSSEAMAEGSPQGALDRGEPVMLPPMLLLQGTADEIVTPDIQHRFRDTYAEAGGQVELKLYEGMPHSFISRTPEHPQAVRAIADIIEFIYRR